MKARNVIVMIIAMLLLLPTGVQADSTLSLKKLDNISDEALQMVKTYRYEEAKKLLDHFEKEFLTVTGKGHLFSMDELRIITVSHDEATEAVVSTTMTHEERINRVTKLRLVLDAVTSTYQPLWSEMETSIMTVFSGLKTAVQNGNDEDFKMKLNSFLSLYSVIYPSLKVDITPERVQQLNARVNYIHHYQPEVLTESSGQMQLEALERDLRSIFGGMTEDETDPSLWWVIISTGSIIILTLSYVGWKKYRADKERRVNRLKELKN